MVHLRVTALPFMFLAKLSEDGTISGRYGGLFHSACILMNCTYEINLPPDYGWGACNQTSCSGMFGPLLDNVSDVALGPHSLLEAYDRHFIPGAPLSNERFVIITGMLTAYGIDSVSVLRVLDSGMTTTLFVAPWFIAGIVLIFAWLENRRASSEVGVTDRVDFGMLVISLYQTILNQSGQYTHKSAKSRLVLVAFILTCLFLTILFSSFVKASMMTKPPTKRISHLRQLVKEKNLRPLVLGRTFIVDLIKAQAEVNKDYRELDGMFEKYGLIELPQDAVSMATTNAIFNGTGFTISDCELFKYFFYYGWTAIPRVEKGYHYCSKDYVVTAYVTWYFNKYSVPHDFIREFNRRSRWLVESPQKFVREYALPQIPVWSQVYDTPLTDEKADPIALHDILGSVFIYFGGLGLASFIFLLEWLPQITVRVFRKALV